jgi:hypothetical protein
VLAGRPSIDRPPGWSIPTLVTFDRPFLIPPRPTHNQPREFALVSLVDPNCKDAGAKRVEKLEELPKLLAAILQQPAYIPEEEGEEYEYDEDGNARPVVSRRRASAAGAAAAAAAVMAGMETVYVRVLRPSGPTYTVLELPGLPEGLGEEGDAELEAQVREVLVRHPNYLLLALVPVPDLFDRAVSVRMAKEVGGWVGGMVGVGLGGRLFGVCIRHGKRTDPRLIIMAARTNAGGSGVEADDRGGDEDGPGGEGHGRGGEAPDDQPQGLGAPARVRACVPAICVAVFVCWGGLVVVHARFGMSSPPHSLTAIHPSPTTHPTQTTQT